MIKLSLSEQGSFGLVTLTEFYATPHPYLPKVIHPTPQNTTPTKQPPLRNWNTLRHDLAITPEAQTLLDTYGISAWESLEHDLSRHPYLQTRNTFDQGYTNALWHRTLHAACNDGQLTEKTYKELEDITGIPWGRIRDWELGEKEPHLERTLNIHETARQHWETQLPHEAKDHLLDPSLVYNTFKSLLNHPETQTPKALATAIETLYHYGKNTRLIIAELKPYHRIGPQDLRTLAHTITDHQTHITNLLNQHLSLTTSHEELHLAIDHDVLFLWRKTTESDYWPNALKSELLYLKPEIKENLIEIAQRYLNVNKQQLGQLIDQLTDHPRKKLHKPRAIPYELYPTKYSQYLYGDTLHLLLDATNQPFTTIKPHITQIGRISNLEKGGGLKNPIFLEKQKLQKLRARLIAIALSDCHINYKTHVLTYHEKDIERIDYVKSLFRQLGDADYQIEELAGQRKRLTITAVVGRLLEQWGVPRGDKHLHPNFRLPPSIRNSSPYIKRAYLQEVIPEEGYFVKRAHYQFGIKRAQILDSSTRGGNYNLEPKISLKEKAFIQKYGRERIYKIREDKPRTEFILTWGTLKRLAKDENLEDSRIAQKLIKTVQKNPCQLLEDEIQLARSLGIQMYQLIKEIHLHGKNRVSVICEAYTRTRKDTFKWVQIAMPSTGSKRTAAQAWLRWYKEKALTRTNTMKGPKFAI